MKLASNQATSDRSKHIDLKLFFIREMVEEKKIILSYIPSEENLADQFTKIIPKDRLLDHKLKMGVNDKDPRSRGSVNINC